MVVQQKKIQEYIKIYRMSDIGKIGKLLMMEEPFYGFFLLNLNKEFSTSLPTAGVGKSGINQMLYINPNFWGNLSDNHKLGLLKHELLHICFFHLIMRNSFNDKKLFNIAADLEINQYIKPEWLPEGGITMESFPTLSLDLKAGTNYYYHKLLENYNSPNPDNNLKSMMDAQNGISSDSNNGGENGNNESGGNGGNGDLHPTWKEFDDLPEAAKKLIQNQTEHILKESATQITKSRGYIPGELKSKIDELFKINEPAFNWKAYLRRKLGGANEIYTKKSRRKLSKRFVDNAGIKVKQKHHVLVARDTSGSVSNSELMEFESEIHHIYKAGTRITVIDCDARIQDIYEYKGKYNDSAKGRGGTSFDPVLEYYDDNRDKYTSLVFFTDGECSTKIKPKKEVIWVISSRGRVFDKLPGLIINIPKHE